MPLIVNLLLCWSLVGLLGVCGGPTEWDAPTGTTLPHLCVCVYIHTHGPPS